MPGELRSSASPPGCLPTHGRGPPRVHFVVNPDRSVVWIHHQGRQGRTQDQWPESTNWPALGGSLVALVALLGNAHVTLSSPSMNAPRSGMFQLEDAYSRTGMRLSTKIMLLHINRPPAPAPSTSCFQLRVTVEPVQSFAHLGSDVSEVANHSPLAGSPRSCQPPK